MTEKIQTWNSEIAYQYIQRCSAGKFNSSDPVAKQEMIDVCIDILNLDKPELHRALNIFERIINYQINDGKEEIIIDPRQIISLVKGVKTGREIRKNIKRRRLGILS